MFKHHWDPIFEDIAAHVRSGQFIVDRIDRKSGFRGPDEFHIIITDVSSAQSAPTYLNTLKTLPLPPPYQGATGATMPPQFVAAAGFDALDVPAASIPTRTSKDPIIGYRDFLVANSTAGPLLISRNEAVWHPRQAHQAFCKQSAFSTHDAPDPSCQCGIYAFAHPDHKELKSGDVCWAEVALWGDVLLCGQTTKAPPALKQEIWGYRAEFAYPQTLFLEDKGTKAIRWLRDELERAYGVPVFLVDKREGKTVGEVIAELIREELADQS